MLVLLLFLLYFSSCISRHACLFLKIVLVRPSLRKIYIMYDLTFSMVKKYNMIIEKDEEGWLVSEVVGLPGCHTQAKTMDQIIERTKEAIRAYLGENKNPKISEQFVGVQQIEV